MPNQDKIDIPRLLRELPLFTELTPQDLEQIAAGTREKKLQKGEVLFHRGDVPKGFYYMISGSVKLAFSSPQGNEKVVEVLGARQSFGEAVLFMDRSYPVTAEALVESRVLHIGSAVVSELLGQDLGFAKKLLAGMAIRLHSMVRDVEAYSLRSSAQRVIGYLLQLSHDAPCATAPLVEVELPTSKQVLASRLNLTPETLSRIFGELSNAGLIGVKGRHIVLHDPAALARYEG